MNEAPSAATLALLRSGSTARERQLALLGFGDPVFDSSQPKATTVAAAHGEITFRAIGGIRELSSAELADLPRLPNTADEIEDIAAVVSADPDLDIFLGERASKAEIRRRNASGDLWAYNLISFANHWFVPDDMDELQSPALALSAPTQTPAGE